MVIEKRQGLRHNYIAFGADTILFSIGFIAFLNVNVLLPTFVEQVGGAPTMVGILTTVIGLAWSAPQLIGGNVVSRFRRKKPFVLAMAVSGRVFILAFAALIYFTQGQPPWLSLAGLFAALILFLSTDGFATIGWMDILSRAIPADRRGVAISIWQAITSVGILAVSAGISAIIGENGPGFPNNYALLFGLGGLMLLVSLLGTIAIREPDIAEDEPETQPVAWGELFRHLLEIWNSDPRLRAVTIARVSFSFAMMAYPFYVGYATKVLGLPLESVAQFIIAQTIGTIVSSLVLGRIADRYGAQRAVQIGSAIILTAPVMALIVVFAHDSLSTWIALIYSWIYVCSGLANNLLFLGFANYTLQIAPPNKRPMYTGGVNAINSIGVMAPSVAGWLLVLTSYGALFGVTLALGIVALVLTFRLPPTRPSAVVTDAHG